MLYRVSAILWVAMSFCALSPAQGTADDQEEELLLSINVGYNTAYREKSWVPVEVLIHNEQNDLEGWLEIRTFDGANQLQSPLYRVAIDCPRDSQKIFRLNAYLDATARVEAWVYENRRLAVDSPAYIQTRPIESTDLLGLVLDDELLDFGFLYAAVQPASGSLRFFRHGLTTSRLAELPTIAQAYDAFDVIIMGDFDPDRVPMAARGHIRDYVERGGTLIVCTGLQAAAYRGSWVADLLGVTLGRTENSNGQALAGATLPPELREGARADRQCVVVDLRPRDGEVQTLGHEKTLATLHRVGLGNVYTLAVDTASHVLQDTAGYRALWREMVHSREREHPLNFEALSRTVSEALPNLSGVTIRPLSSVMTYLLLYLGVGVVGNWIFWNAFKRREMAWVCLVVFSAAFTVYAMIFGRSGWADTAELQRVEVLHFRSGRDTADYHGLVGILAARTRSYSADLGREGLLVRNAASFNLNFFGMSQGLPSRGTGSRPFRYIQGEPGRIENFRVGASELRLVHVEGEADVAGGVEGTITVDRDGIRGTLVNGLGLDLMGPMLLYNGTFYPLQPTATGWSIEMGRARLATWRDRSALNPGELQYIAQRGRINEAELRRLARLSLFSDDDMQIGVEHPAYLVGWAQDFELDALVPEQEVVTKVSETLVVAGVNLFEDNIARRTPLSVSLRRDRILWVRYQGGTQDIFRRHQTTKTPGDLLVQLPDTVAASPGEIVVHLYWKGDNKDFEVYLAPEGEESRSLHELASTGPSARNGDIEHTEYRFSDWGAYLDTDYGQILRFRVLSGRVLDDSTEDGEERPADGRLNPSDFARMRGVYTASAEFILNERAGMNARDNSGDWPLWQ